MLKLPNFTLILLILLLIPISKGVALDLSKCITPPISDDSKVNEQIRKDCEEDLKRRDFIATNKSQMAEASKKACANDCSPSEKQALAELYQLSCATYCQNVVPKNLQKDLSCSSDNMCSWMNTSKQREWQDVASNCLNGVGQGGKTFLNQLGATADAIHMAPRKLTESAIHFSKNTWKKGFHQAINDEATSTDRTIRAQIKKIKGFPDFITEQYEILKCLDSKVAEKMACNLGTVVLLDAATGGVGKKLLTAAAKADLVKKAADRTSNTSETVDDLTPPTAQSAATSEIGQKIDPATGLPIIPDEALARDRRRSESTSSPEASNSTQPKDFWDQRSKAVAKGDEALLKKASPIYQKALKDKDPHTEFLQRAGYNFEPGQEKSASLKEVGGQYHDEISSKAKALGIKEDDILIASSPFKLPNGEIKFIKVGDEIPKGSMPLSVDLTDREFMDVVASGRFPLSEGEPYPRMPMTIKEHDAAHLSGFIEHPEAMAELSRQAKKLKETGGLDRHYGKPDEENFDPLRLRVFTVLETSSYYSPAARKPLSSRAPSLKEGQIVKPGDLKKDLAKLNQGELSQMISDVDVIQSQQSHHFGGGGRDVVHRDANHAIFDLSPVHQATLEVQRLKELRSRMQRTTNPTESARLESQIRDSLARVAATQWNFSQIQPQEMVRGAFEHNSPEGRRLRDIYCASHGISKETDKKVAKTFSCGKWF